MTHFLFDLSLIATVRVDAESEEQARAAIMAELSGAEELLTTTAENGATVCLSQIAPTGTGENIALVECDGEATGNVAALAVLKGAQA